MKNAIRLSVLLYTIFISGCAQRPTYYPVKDHQPRQNSLGFSISPPTGTSWYETLQGTSLIYYKKTELDDYLLYAKASEVELKTAPINTQEFTTWVKSEKEIALSPSRYKNINFTLKPEPDISKYCLRYSRTYEDHGGSTDTNEDELFFTIENSGIYCLHPDSGNVGVDISFVEKLPQTILHSQFRDEVRSFMKSLRFQSLNQS